MPLTQENKAIDFSMEELPPRLRPTVGDMYRMPRSLSPDGMGVAIRELVSLVCELMGRDFEASVDIVADRPGHDARYAIDATRLERELGWRAQEDFESGIAKTVRWYLDNEWWWRPLSTRYAGERLGIVNGKDAA